MRGVIIVIDEWSKYRPLNLNEWCKLKGPLKISRDLVLTFPTRVHLISGKKEGNTRFIFRRSSLPESH